MPSAFEPNLPPPDLGTSRPALRFPSVTWPVRGPKDRPPAPPVPPTDFQRLADAVTTLYTSGGTGQPASTPVVVTGGGSSGGGGTSPLAVLVLGIVAAVLGYLVIRWWQRRAKAA